MSRSALVLALLAALVSAGSISSAGSPSLSVWGGVYTEQQALRGRAVYAEPCGKCHGFRLDGAPDDPDMFSTPPLAGPKFLREWNGRSLGALLQYSRVTMPANNPGSLNAAELVDVLAYMLYASGIPPGDSELPADERVLADVAISLQTNRH